MATFILKNGKMKAEISTLGAEVVNLWYEGIPVGTKGAIKGRVANRIRGASFELNGRTYNLDKNHGEHQLHGGSAGFSKKDWDVESEENTCVCLGIVSPDGDMGFPGELKLTVKYELLEDSLRISYEAQSDADTLFNPVNHLYLNLNGEGASEGAEVHEKHELQIEADYYTERDDEILPTGRIIPVDGTEYDFREMKPYRGYYDDNFVLKDEGCRLVARLRGTESDLACEMYTDRPGMQLYNTDTEICLEAQGFPDAIHHPEFPSVVLKRGELFMSTTEYKFV